MTVQRSISEFWPLNFEFHTFKIGYGFTQIRSHLKNRKIVRGQGRHRIVTGGIYVNILRITIQTGRRDRAI